MEAVFARPRAPFKDLKTFLRLLAARPGALLFGGDWNAQDDQWDAAGANVRGRVTANMRNFRVAASYGFTFAGTAGSQSTVDFFLYRGAIIMVASSTAATDGFLSPPNAHRPINVDIQWRDTGCMDEREIRPSVLQSKVVQEKAKGH
jgi:hypothetical protein